MNAAYRPVAEHQGHAIYRTGSRRYYTCGAEFRSLKAARASIDSDKAALAAAAERSQATHAALLDVAALHSEAVTALERAVRTFDEGNREASQLACERAGARVRFFSRLLKHAPTLLDG